MQREDNARTVEGEVSSWPGIVPGGGRFGSTVYRLGRREIGHLHRNGVADLPIPDSGMPCGPRKLGKRRSSILRRALKTAYSS